MTHTRIKRIRAANPSPMTLDGTNTYLIHAAGDRAIVIDPGPAIPEHIDAICAEADVDGWTIAAIAVTHGHPDHAPGARLLSERTNVPVYAHPQARFPHDRELADGERLILGDVALQAIHTPGHARDHLVFWFDDERALFTGDVILGSGTVVIAPPGGDMRVYQATLDRLRRDFSDAHRIEGGHGESVEDPLAKLDEYIEHRKNREREIIAVLEGGPATIPAIVERVYHAIPQPLWPAAARQVLAYVIALERERRIRSRRLDRPPNADEATILNPDLSRIVDPSSRAVAAAELGIDRSVTTVDEYALN